MSIQTYKIALIWIIHSKYNGGIIKLSVLFMVVKYKVRRLKSKY